jgi:hypothetical protein
MALVHRRTTVQDEPQLSHATLVSKQDLGLDPKFSHPADEMNALTKGVRKWMSETNVKVNELLGMSVSSLKPCLVDVFLAHSELPEAIRCNVIVRENTTTIKVEGAIGNAYTR